MKYTDKRTLILANIIWILIIFILCAMPSEDIPDPHLDIPHLDKVIHFGMFFILSLLIILTAFIYGGLIEILQHYFFNRGGDVWDLAADIAGGIAGCLCYPVTKRIFKIKH